MSDKSEDIEAQKFLGWKVLVYNTKYKLLSSPQQAFDWRPKKPAQAFCGLAHEERELEYSKCSCGIYARKDPDKELQHYLAGGFGSNYRGSVETISVIAQIAMWGWVHEGSTGYRGLYAYPRAIFLQAESEHAEHIRTAYEVPVIVEPELFGKRGTPEALKQPVDLSKYSRAQIDQAIRQARYHKWYNRRKTIVKNLAAWERTYKDAPARIAALRSELRAHDSSKP